jgi:7,8-dihydropterin-6-yl-methyl-4-(beta-D-ribofuranosyl)aminobenzene 5'-phosphate synthase
LKLTVLVDNNTLIDRYFLAEPGVCFYIETEGKKILFDAGYSDVFIRNANKIGIRLQDLDMVVLSHGHLDHTWGLTHLVQLLAETQTEEKRNKKPSLIAHPLAFASRSHRSEKEIGSILKEDTLKKFFNLKLTREPLKLTGKMTFLGEISRLNDFEGKKSIGMIFVDGKETPDFIPDDSAVAFHSKDGLVVITGCSHSGICNIIEQARRVTGVQTIADVIGGFHLLAPSQKQLQGTLDYFQRLKPAAVHACHCTDLKSKIALASVVNLREVGAGMILENS